MAQSHRVRVNHARMYVTVASANVAADVEIPLT